MNVTAWSHWHLLCSIKLSRVLRVERDWRLREWSLRLWWGISVPTRPNWWLLALISKPQARLLYHWLSERTFMIQTEISSLSKGSLLCLQGILLESPLASNWLSLGPALWNNNPRLWKSWETKAEKVNVGCHGESKYVCFQFFLLWLFLCHDLETGTKRKKIIWLSVPTCPVCLHLQLLFNVKNLRHNTADKTLHFSTER